MKNPQKGERTLEDNRIIALYTNRDITAIKETAAKYGSRLKSISYGITEDRQTAEEYENDTYLEAWNTIPPHNPMDYLFVFLVRIVRHISLDACRTRSRLKRSAAITELTTELEERIPDPDDTACKLEYKELGEAISQYLYTLSEEKQMIFIRRYWYLDSVDAIARHLGIGLSKVKMTLLRCRHGLKEYLEKEGYDL